MHLQYTVPHRRPDFMANKIEISIQRSHLSSFLGSIARYSTAWVLPAFLATCFLCGASFPIGITLAASSQARGSQDSNVKYLAAEETKRILRATKHSIDPEISRAILSTAFDLNSGGVLLVQEGGKGVLWESKAELLAVLEKTEYFPRFVDVIDNGESFTVVTGAPFSASALSETTRTLPTRVQIRDRTQSKISRDSQGRIRKEVVTSTRFGQRTSSVFINDPVVDRGLVLDPGEKIAQILGEAFPNMNTEHKAFPDPFRHDEDLGTQIISGVSVQGVRTTTTIPGRQTGNEKPMILVNESWYSKNLHVIVFGKNSRPGYYESTYKLTDIHLGEPDASLFSIPAGYTLIKWRR